MPQTKKKKPAAKKKPYFANTDKYKKKVQAGTKPGAAKKATRKYKVKQAVSKVTSVRKKRQAAGKWTIGEKLTAAGRKRAEARKQKREATKMNKPMKRVQAGKSAKGTGVVSTKKSRAKAIGAKKGTVVQRKAVKKVSTKGGDYVKYEKKSKAAGSFRSTFKSKCAGGAKSFSWDGRSYSCAKAGPKKAKKAITRGGAKASDPA